MERLLGPEELAARYDRVTVETLRYWRRKGTGPAWFRVGKHVQYRESDVLAYEAEQRAEQQAGKRAS